MLSAVSKCRRRSDPGHNHNERWQLRGYWLTCLLVMLLLVLLIVLSMALEWGRERQWSFTKHLTRTQTAIPLIIACVVLMCAVLELICLYPTIITLMRLRETSSSSAVNGGSHGQDVDTEMAMDGSDDGENGDEELSPPRKTAHQQESDNDEEDDNIQNPDQDSVYSNSALLNNGSNATGLSRRGGGNGSGTPRLGIDPPLSLDKPVHETAVYATTTL